MRGGWAGGQCWILFEAEERGRATEAYGLREFLPGYEVWGILGYEDLIVQDKQGRHFVVPTVPLTTEHLRGLGESVPLEELEPDPGHAGRIKWYIQPLIFGGDPASSTNVTWVEPAKHAELVVWWNRKFRELQAGRGVP